MDFRVFQSMENGSGENCGKNWMIAWKFQNGSHWWVNQDSKTNSNHKTEATEVLQYIYNPNEKISQRSLKFE